MKNNQHIFLSKCVAIVVLVSISACHRNQFKVQPTTTNKSNMDSSVVFLPNNDTAIFRGQNQEYKIQNQNYTIAISPQTIYDNAFEELKAMLEDKQPLSFKRAVFVVENAYLDNELNYPVFSDYVSYLSLVAKKWKDANPLKNYYYADSVNTALNGAIFYSLTDTVFGKDSTIVNTPYTYDFEDCFGSQKWTNMFVSKLLITHKGNCHSLPFLYKMVAEELGAKVWLSYTPNHIYLRNRCKKTGWYNTEMTNALFPNEGWIMASGYVSVESIVSGLYMDTLGLKQSISVCVNDLAKGHARKLGANETQTDLEFVLKCCDLGLKYYPKFAELLYLKAETHNKMMHLYEKTYGLNVQNSNDPRSKEVKYHISEMNSSYQLLFHYGYREIPEEMFKEWFKSLEDNKEKYQNQKISDTFNYEK